MTSEQYSLLVFDWDGTLMDSVAHIVDSLQYAMRETGVEVLDRQQSKDIIGLGMREAIEALFPNRVDDEKFIQAYIESYKNYYHESAHKTKLFDGAESTLNQLKDVGYTLAVATGKGRNGLDKVLLQTGLGQLFQATYCADETRSKPHPDMIEAILRDTGFRADQAIMIGDSEFDLEMASNASVKSIGASYGVHDESRLNRHNPVGMLNHISDLPALLERTN